MSDQLLAAARHIVALFFQKARQSFSQRVQAVFQFGSLGQHGDFSSCSDVDVVLMLDEMNETDALQVQKVWDEILALDVLFADRLSVFWSTYHDKDFTQAKGRFPALDRQDFIENAVLVYGVDKRQQLSKPSANQIIIESAKFIETYLLSSVKLKQLLHDHQQIIDQGARYVTKCVLFPVRLLFTLDHSGVIASNHQAVVHYQQRYAHVWIEQARLVKQAYVWRSLAANQKIEQGVDWLDQSLLGLYHHCIKRYQQQMLTLGEQRLAARLENFLVKFILQ